MSRALRITGRLLRYPWPYRRQVVIAYASMMVVTALTMVVPAILGWVVDVGLTPPSERTAELVAVADWLPGDQRLEAFGLRAGPSLLLWAAGTVVALAMARSIFAFGQMYLGAWLSERVAYDIRNAYFRHVQHLSFAFHDRSQTGDLMSRAITDISKVQQFVGQGLLEAANVPVLFVAVSVVLARIDGALAVVVLSPLVVLAIVTVRFGQVIEPRFKAVQDQEGVISTRAQENFSGKRIAIARAIIMQPRVLILDDATSSVDTETEHQIQSALAELMHGRTTFVIAQRLLTLKSADVILVMDHGRIVERGTHSQLVGAGGLYSRIYELQLADQETVAEAGGGGGGRP